MLTIEDAKTYLKTVGVTLPDFLLSALLEQMSDIQACLDANGVNPGTQTLIYTYLLGLLGLSQGDKYVSSESAPSGASRSYRYMALGDRYNALRGLLKQADKFGCADALIPPDPTASAFGGIWVSEGGCYE